VNFFDILRDHAINRPDHAAIEDGTRVVSYLELNGLIDWGAANLRQRGIEVGNVVGVMLGNTADNLIAAAALARAGGVLLSISPDLPHDEVSSKLQELNAAALIVQSVTSQRFDVPCHSVTEILTPCKTVDSLSRAGGPDPFGIVESSGTTGNAKRIVVSHADLLQRWHRFMSFQKWIPAERYSSLIDLHFNSSRRDYNFVLRLGATAVVLKNRSMAKFVRFVNEKRISHLRLTPGPLRQMLNSVPDESLLFPGLRRLAVVGSPITAAERAATRKYLTPSLVEAYGTNETGTLAYSTPELQIIEPESVGRIVSGVEAQIVDKDGVELPAGTAGLARFRADDFPKEYLDNPAATEKYFHDGWFYPGDVAVLNEAGFLFLKGRSDDAIISSGTNIYPIEIENILLSHPEVEEAAVFSWPHAIAGQVAAAIVVAKSDITMQKLKSFCASNATSYKVPYILAEVKSMPRNPMGNVLKSELAAMLRQQLRQLNSD
jgi:acyl-coenzyme A synthetase/AMP-(fatty) acid ligase